MHKLHTTIINRSKALSFILITVNHFEIHLNEPAVKEMQSFMEHDGR